VADSLLGVDAAGLGNHVRIREAPGSASGSIHDAVKVSLLGFEVAGELILGVISTGSLEAV